MSMRFRNIRFLGKNWLLVGETSGAITTVESYSHGICSFAHLHENGTISRYGILIGLREDIVFGDEATEPKLSDDVFENLGSSLAGWI